MSSQNSICMAWHGTMAKYLKKTTDLTIGINALISGSDIHHILYTYIHTKIGLIRALVPG